MNYNRSFGNYNKTNLNRYSSYDSFENNRTFREHN